MDLWIGRFGAIHSPRVRLFCFPYAGGSAQLYRGWRRFLKPDVELLGIDPPGRYQRLRETPYRRASALVAALLEVAVPLFDRPFGVFGHSMGALLALELAYQLRARGLAAPRHLFLSARPAPHMALAYPLLHRLDDDSLWRYIQDRGGLPAWAHEDDELRKMLLPLMRADMELTETYKAEGQRPLDIPLTVLGGSDDDHPTPAQLRDWASYTSASFQEKIFPGGHFFLRSEERTLAEFVDSVLSETVPPA